MFFLYLAGFMASMAVIGLIPTVPIFITTLMRLEGRERWPVVVPMAAVMTLLVYGVFDRLLEVPWPPSLMGGWFPALHAIPSV
ncbi:MAG: tripartite tricarboxylate transporter TctB family protein [Pseudomonadota bacterium]